MEFLEEIMAQVFSSEKELKKYIEDEGIDLEGDITDELEVFKLTDGRVIYVEEKDSRTFTGIIRGY